MARSRDTPPAGEAYSRNDTQLLTWVQATAAFGFAEAYHRYVGPLSPAELDALYREGAPASRLYGALGAPKSDAELKALFDSMRKRLEPSPIIFQFLEIMRDVPAFPRPLLWMQGMLVRAAVDMIPDWIRERLGLTSSYGLRGRERWFVKCPELCRIESFCRKAPRRQSCVRLGLPITHLYA